MVHTAVGARGWLLLSGVALLACGKATEERPTAADECEAGTVLVDGECVAEDSATGGASGGGGEAPGRAGDGAGGVNDGGSAAGGAGDGGSAAGSASDGGSAAGSANESGGQATGGASGSGSATGGAVAGSAGAGPDTGGNGLGTGGSALGGGGTGGTVPLGPADRVDLLLVIDNSISMADKQAVLRETLPELVEQLTSPDCVDGDGLLTRRPAAGGPCPAGTVEAFAPVVDLHAAVITSSLGGHGGIACTPAEGSTWVPEKDDRAELIAPLRGVASFQNLGFLAWDARAEPEPGTTADIATLVSDFDAIVAAAGETGCGYEAPLEAWYRFLVDPMPPTAVMNDGAASVVDGFNTTLLEQRAQFLRPDSLVAIVMLTDENDCSVRDDGPGFYVAGTSSGGKLPRAAQVCATDPNDPCCRSCALAEASPPEGCTELDVDPACLLGPFAREEEHANLRCYEQERRFGIDFLNPTRRYVAGLTDPLVYGRACTADADCLGSPQQPDGGTCVEVGGGARYCRYANPLFSASAVYPDLTPRPDSRRIYLAGIVGVPWQDLATEATLTSATDLELLSVTDPAFASRWDVILGDPDAEPRLYPADPFMWESVTPRVGVHALSGLPFPEANPVTGDRPLDPSSAGAASPINGHEYTVTDGGDLQFACSFPLATPRLCSDDVEVGCDCRGEDTNLATKPLCQEPGSTVAGTTQYAAKAYPGLRHLALLRDFGENAIVGSTCPKVMGDPDSPAYGYRPAVRAIVRRLAEQLPRP